VKLHDAYLSVHEALKHSGVHHGCSVRVRWFDAENMTLEEATRELEESTACSFPAASARAAGEGKMLACRVARERESRTSASASACTSRCRSSRGTSSGSTARTRRRWIPRRRIR
jgi:hypothetical protein